MTPGELNHHHHPNIHTRNSTEAEPKKKNSKESGGKRVKSQEQPKIQRGKGASVCLGMLCLRPRGGKVFAEGGHFKRE